MYENQISINNLLEPTELIEEINQIIEEIGLENQIFEQQESKIFINKEKVPLSQLFALYAINKISTTANSN
jgi:DNA (cytosine-5)-methyltransferase 1